MRRLLIVVLGILLAFLGACCFLATAVFLESVAAPAQTSLALFNVAALVIANLQGGGAGALLQAGLMTLWLALLALCLAPVSAVALLGEAAGARSLIWSAGATGAATAGMPTILRAIAEAPASLGRAGEGRATLILFLTGLASGFVYWIIAGRSAPRAGTLR